MVEGDAYFMDYNSDISGGPWLNEMLILFTKENNQWKILSFQSQLLLPAIYKKLNNKYSGAGSANLIYVGHGTQNFVSVIDTKTDSLIGIIHPD